MHRITNPGSAPRALGIARLLCAVLAVGLALGVTARPSARADGGCIATGPCLVNNGGRVLKHPQIHNLYFDLNWDADTPDDLRTENIDQFTSQLVSSNYFAAAGQYGVDAPSFNGSDEATILCPPPNLGGVTDFFSILGWVTCETQIGPDPFIRPTLTGVPTPDDNSLYVVYLPPGMQIDDAAIHTCDGFTAYHFMATVPAWQYPTLDGVPLPPVPGSQDIAFAVVPLDCVLNAEDFPSGAQTPFDALTENASHEIIEAATDPTIPTGWIDNSLLGFNIDILTQGEAADICEQNASTESARLADGLLVARYWSNLENGVAGACEPVGAHRFQLDETGLPMSVSSPVATFDGESVTLPFSTLVDDGTTHSYSFPSPVNDSNPGIRYVTTEQPATLDVTTDVAKIATYTTQFSLTVQAAPAAAAVGDTTLTPSDWETQGSIVTLTTDALIATGAGDRYRFDHWSGDASGTSAATTILMDGPKSATANYALQHVLTVNTSGLGANTATITNGTTILGTANDSAPLVVWVDDGPLALAASANVNGADGTQYFFQGFTPAAPATLSAAFTTTAAYKTLAQLISDALASGGITGPGASGLANSLTQQVAAVQSDMGSQRYARALGDLQSFISHVQAQCCTSQAGKALSTSTAQTFQIDALLVYQSALCPALANGQISAATAAADYTYYSTLVASLGGTVLPPC